MIETGEIEEDDKPTDEDLRRFDRKRSKKGEKNVSNTDWESPTDPDSRTVKMRFSPDPLLWIAGRIHLGYKIEHVVDLETELILHAGVHHGTDHDTQTLVGNVVSAPASNTLDILKNKSLTGCWQMIIWALHNFSHFPPTPRRYVFWPLFTVLVLADFCKKEFESGGFVRFDEVITGVGFFDYYESTAAC